MKTVPDIKIHFYYSELRSDDRGQIYFKVRMKPDRPARRVPSGISIFKHEWDRKLKQVNSHNEFYRDINAELHQRIEGCYTFCYNVLFKENRVVTFSMIKKYLQNSDTDGYTFSDFISDPNVYKYKLTGAKASKGTTGNRRQCVNHINRWRKNIGFDEVNDQLLKEFTKYLFSGGKQPNYINKVQIVFSTLVKMAKEEGLIPHDRPFLTPRNKVRYEQTRIDWLTPSELRKICMYKPDNYIDMYTKNKFVAACFTGLSWRDITNINRTHIKNTERGKIFLKRRQKTYKMVEIPLYKIFDGAADIALENYLRTYRLREEFNGKDNEYLEKICKTVGIRKVTFHVARHTFLSYISAIYKQPYVIMQYSGLTEMKTATRYIHSSIDFFDGLDIDWVEMVSHLRYDVYKDADWYDYLRMD